MKIKLILFKIVIIVFFNNNVFANSIIYKYDDFSRLTNIAYSNGTVIQYTYDKLGNRTKIVVNINHTPIISGIPVNNVEEDFQYTFLPNAYDEDGDQITFSIENKPNWANFDSSSGKLYGIPSNINVGVSNQIIISVIDDKGNKMSLPAFEITVININDAPEINTGISVMLSNINEDAETNTGDSIRDILKDCIITDVDNEQVKSIAVSKIDNINGQWQFSIDQGINWNNFSGAFEQQVDLTSKAILLDSECRVRFVPNSNFNGKSNFSFRAWDKSSYNTGDKIDVSINGGNTAFSINEVTADILINSVNDIPVAFEENITVNEDESKTGNLIANDIDFDALNYIIVERSKKGKVDIDNITGSYVYTPYENANGSDSFSFKVNDGTEDSNIATVSISISPVNDLPVANNGNLRTNEDEAIYGQLLASDIDSENLDYIIVEQSVKGTVVILNDSGAYAYTPNENANGTDSFSFIVNDGIADSNIATVSISISPVNDLPVAINGNLNTNEDEVINGQLISSDIDSDPLNYILVEQSVKGTVVILNDTGAYVYTPNENANGSDSFSFKVNDGIRDSDIATVSISISPVNDLPVANNGNLKTNEDEAIYGQLFSSDNDSDPLDYIIVEQSLKGTVVILNDSGAYVYTPNDNENGSDSFSFKVNDGIHDSNIATVSISISPVNDIPVSNNGNLVTNEDEIFNGQLVSTDIDSDPLDYIIVEHSLKGTVVILNDSGAYAYTPNENANGTDSFSFKVNDGIADSNIATVSISISPVNDLPVAINGNLNTNEDEVINGQLISSDIDSDPLNYIIVEQSVKGTVVIHNDTGAYVYTPNENANGSDSFSFKVNDGIRDSDIATVSISISPVNDLPVANNGNLKTNEDEAIYGQLIGSDIDSENFDYIIVEQSLKGTVVILNDSGAYVYTPNENANGSDSFSFKVNDGIGNSNIATVSISISPVNDLPVANNGNLRTNEDEAIYGQLLASDIDSENLDYIIVEQSVKGTVVILNDSGAYAYTPNENANGTDSFSFKVNDGIADSNNATVSISISPVNDLPVANNGNLKTNEDEAIYGQLFSSDNDSDPLDYIIVEQSLKGTVVILNDSGVYIYTPYENANGSDSFSFKVNDGVEDSNIATVFISISPVNDLPVANIGNLVTNEDEIFNGQLVSTDIDSDPLDYIIVEQSLKGTVDILNDSGAYVYTPNDNENGSDSFSFKVNDGIEDSNIATVSISISPVNDFPVANNGNLTTNEDEATNGQLISSDIDSDPLDYIIVEQSLKGTIAIVNDSGAYVYTPNDNENGSDSFSFKVNDGIENSNIATVFISISSVNDIPVSNNGNLVTNEDEIFNGQLVSTDIDSDPLDYIIVEQSLKGTIAIVNDSGAYVYTPNDNENGSDSFSFKVNDGIEDSNIATVSISITPVNDLPVANNGNLKTNEDEAINGQLISSDIDSDPLDYIIVEQSLKGTIAIVNDSGAYAYTPNENANGTDSFSFKVNDGIGNSNIATVSISISPVNDLPVANNGNLKTNEDEAIYVQLIASDIDSENLDYIIVEQSLKGTVVILNDSGAYVYTPNENANGSDSFSFKVNDGIGNSNIATVSISISSVNDLPVANNGNLKTNEDEVINGQLITSDIDSDPLDYIIVEQSVKGTVVILNDSGAYVYTPNDNENGSDSFSFKVNDGIEDSNIATVSISISPVNDLPVANNGNLKTNEDETINGQLIASDIDSENLDYIIVEQGFKGTIAIVNESGAYVYTPKDNANGSDSISFRVNDGIEDSNIATLFISISPVNDLPVSNNGNLVTNEDEIFNGQLISSDIDSDPLDYIIVEQSMKGTVVILNDSGAYIYTPYENANGSDSFSFKVNDGIEDSNIATVSISISPVNDLPVANNGKIQTNEDEPIYGQLIASDIDFDALDYIIVEQSLKGTVTIVNDSGAYLYTPNENKNGLDFFTFKVNDGIYDSDIANITIVIGPENDMPSALSESLTVTEDSALYYKLTGFDIDNDTLIYKIKSKPENGTITLTNSTTGDIIYLSHPNKTGTDSFSFLVNDGNINSLEANIEINILPVNDPPVVYDKSYKINDNQKLIKVLEAFDVDNDLLSFKIYESPQKGQLSITDNNSGSFSYLPFKNKHGIDYFKFKATDDALHSNIGTITIEIQDITKPFIEGLIDDNIPTQSKKWAWEASENCTFVYAIDQNQNWNIDQNLEYKNINSISIEGQDGIFYIHVQAKDSVGNLSEIVTVSAILDNTPPEAIIKGFPSNPNELTQVKILIDGDDLIAYKYKLNEKNISPECNISTPIIINQEVEGDYYISVIGKDLAGNWQSEKNATKVSWVFNNVIAGDINDDGVIDINDTIIPLNVLAGMNSYSNIYIQADINLDGIIDLKEAIYIIITSSGSNKTDK